jgi:hypothetical protein
MRKLIVLMALFAMLGTFAVAASGANASEEGSVVARGPENCEEGYFCTWTGGSFNGERTSWPCGGPGDNGAWFYSSMKNRCVNRRVTIGYPHGSQGCVNPGFNIQSVTSSVWNAGALGSRC